MLPSELDQPTTVHGQPLVIEGGDAEQQPLLLGRLHVPRRKGGRRQDKRQGA